MVKIGSVVSEEKMLTDDGQWMTNNAQQQMPTHSNRSPEWLRWPKNINLLPISCICNWEIYLVVKFNFFATGFYPNKLVKLWNYYLLPFFIILVGNSRVSLGIGPKYKTINFSKISSYHFNSFLKYDGPTHSL